MAESAEKRSNKYYFADSSVGSEEYHGLDLTKPFASHGLTNTGTPTCTLVTSEGEIASGDWTAETHGITNVGLPPIYYDATTEVLSIKIKAHTVGRYHFKFYITALYSEEFDNREDTLVYNVYFDVIK